MLIILSAKSMFLTGSSLLIAPIKKTIYLSLFFKTNSSKSTFSPDWLNPITLDFFGIISLMVSFFS